LYQDLKAGRLSTALGDSVVIITTKEVVYGTLK
jgi:hypothetical protein